jgi:predicted O-linked N-acetylglucosamine transferase (SPINDLY family)
MTTVPQAPAAPPSLRELALSAGQAGDLDRARSLLGRAIEAEPKDPRLHELLAGVLERSGRLAEAAEACRAALALDAGFADAHCQLGRVLERLGRSSESAGAFETALDLNPGHPEARVNLARHYRRAGRFAEAAELSAAVARFHLAERRWQDALTHFEHAAAADPANPAHHQGKAAALAALDRVSEGLAACSEALRRDARLASAHSTRGYLLHRQGRLADALEAFHLALDLDPGEREARSALQLSLLSRHIARPGHDAAPPARDYPHAPDPERPLRAGYVAQTLPRPVLDGFLVPVLEAHSGPALCYRNLASERELETRIEADRIDILVDLDGYRRGNLMGALARRPAPVQLTWLYPQATPYSSHLIADNVLEPDSGPHVEGCYLCYRGPDYAPEPAAPPCLDRGHITYGAFTPLARVTPEAAALWSRILARDPKSHLMLKDPVLDDPPSRRLVEAAFAAHGIAADRIELWGGSPHAGLLAWYANIDIALDPLPFSSYTSTCEAMWMGVPVVTLYGATPAGRLASSILVHAGLAGWIAYHEDDYVERALALASDTEILRRIRLLLRRQLASSMAGDTAGFTRRLENVYRTLWRAFCAR